MRAHLREYKFWKDSKKGWRSEGVAEMAVVRYSSTSSFGGLGLSDEDCAMADNIRLNECRVLLYDVPVTRRQSLLCLSLCVSQTEDTTRTAIQPVLHLWI